MASIPHTLWHLYLDTLVNYKQGSWVAKTASTCRVLAFAIIVPFVLLTLLVRPRSPLLPLPPFTPRALTHAGSHAAPTLSKLKLS